MAAGEKRVFSFIVSIHFSSDYSNQGNDTLDAANTDFTKAAAAAASGDALYRGHQEAWGEVWKGGIEVEVRLQYYVNSILDVGRGNTHGAYYVGMITYTDTDTRVSPLYYKPIFHPYHGIPSANLFQGNDALARRINATLYALLSSARKDAAWPAGPGGLPTNGYWGNGFWDNDVWFAPSVLPAWPQLARTAIQYRMGRIGEAATYVNQSQFHYLNGLLRLQAEGYHVISICTSQH